MVNIDLGKGGRIVNMVYILADKVNDHYSGSEIGSTIDQLIEGLEYGDVKGSEYQIWKYPEGTIYSLSVDRELQESQYYVTQGPKDNEVWRVVLQETGVDKSLVSSEYKRLGQSSKQKRSFWSRIFR